MTTLRNLDSVTKIGLTVVATIVIPSVLILLNEIVIKGSVLHY